MWLFLLNLNRAVVNRQPIHARMNLLELPTEILIRVLELSDPYDVAMGWRLVCRLLNELTNDEALWLSLRYPYSQPPPPGYTHEFMFMIENCHKYRFRRVAYVIHDNKKYRGIVDNPFSSSPLADGFGINYICNGTPYGGSVEFGEYRAGVKHGVCIKRYDSSDSYFGGWHNGKKFGFGIYTWDTTEYYRGYWRDDNEYGYGVYQWANGDRYIGDWIQGQKHGFGTHIWGYGPYTGDSYSGSWQMDAQHGFGIYTWTDGRKYSGQFLNHHRNGFGIYEFDSDSRYIGNWRGGYRHGKGMLITKDWIVACEWNGDIPDSPLLTNDPLNGFCMLTKEAQREFIAARKRNTGKRTRDN